MSDLRLRFTLWFLRRFKLFRSLERRLEQVVTHDGYVSRMSDATAARIEAELLYTLILHTHYAVDCDVMPTERVGWLPARQVRVKLFEGGGPRG